MTTIWNYLLTFWPIEAGILAFVFCVYFIRHQNNKGNEKYFTEKKQRMGL